MTLTYVDLDEILHCIRAKFYPSYFATVDGVYTVRTDSEAYLSICWNSCQGLTAIAVRG
jgi:hypothetical protein